MDETIMHALNEERVHLKNSGLSLQALHECTTLPRVIPQDREGGLEANKDSTKIIGGMMNVKKLVKKTRYEEHWLEVSPQSEMICKRCKEISPTCDMWYSITENSRSCLNRASNWTRMGAYEDQNPRYDEHSTDAVVAARVLHVFNDSLEGKEFEAAKDLRGFLLAAVLGVRVTSPAKTCLRELLGQYGVQGEVVTVHNDEHGNVRTKIYFRLLWDGGNVAYHDYVKTMLTPEEFHNIFGGKTTTERVGDIMEFWLGTLEVGTQFPTMFKSWGDGLENCLAGLEDSFWLFANSCRSSVTSNTRKNRSKKVEIAQVEAKMVSRILDESGVTQLLKEHKVTRMPTPPRARDENDPVDVSSEEGDGVEFSPSVDGDQPDPDDEDEDMEQEQDEAEDVEMGEDDAK
eukprot:s1948_g3.t1